MKTLCMLKRHTNEEMCIITLNDIVITIQSVSASLNFNISLVRPYHRVGNKDAE